MIIIYFSGTGNSKYIAETFGKKMNIPSHSIEEILNFEKLLSHHDTICFTFPTYGSKVPRILREFTFKHLHGLKDKKLILFCTQLIFSGDGARAFTDLLPPKHSTIIYAEHFNMPNNICNAPIFKVTNGSENNKYIISANNKLNKVCKNIRIGIVKKRGFNIFSKGLGLIQGAFFPLIEEKKLNSVAVDSDCISCGLCIKICPMKNLSINDNNTVIQHGNCTLCYRCVNACPEKAITAFINKKVRTQYKGIK